MAASENPSCTSAHSCIKSFSRSSTFITLCIHDCHERRSVSQMLRISTLPGLPVGDGPVRAEVRLRAGRYGLGDLGHLLQVLHLQGYANPWARVGEQLPFLEVKALGQVGHVPPLEVVLHQERTRERS